jgi:DNA-directed RNA polymerase subunit RPC12/RpoP
MPKKITPKVVSKYIEEGGVCCPYCGDSGIEGGPVEIMEGIAWQDIKCSECGKEWQDIYKLFAIDPQLGETSTWIEPAAT